MSKELYTMVAWVCLTGALNLALHKFSDEKYVASHPRLSKAVSFLKGLGFDPVVVLSTLAGMLKKPGKP